VLEHGVDSGRREARDRVPGDDHLVAGVDGVEDQVGERHVHRDAGRDDGADAQVAEHGVELGAV